MRCSHCGEQIPDGSIFCFKCGKQVDNDFNNRILTKTEPVTEIDHNQEWINTSGRGSLSVIPEDIKGWSWGACLLNLIWGINYGVYSSLLFLVPGSISFCFSGLVSRETNWHGKTNRWQSIEQFTNTQRQWAQWGVVLWLSGAFISLLVVAYAFDVEEGLGMIGIWVLIAVIALFFVKLMGQKE